MRRRRPPWSPASGEVFRAGALAVRVLGADGPPVVLLHGLVGSAIYWGGAYDRLAEGHRLIVPDLLGFGRSPTPDGGYGPDDHARAVVSCLDALGAREPALVVGHSLGSLVGLRLAATYPQRVRAVVGFGPPLYPDGATARRLAAHTSAMARLLVGSPFAHTVCRWVCDHRGIAARLSVWSHPLLPPPVAADGVRHSWASYSETLERVILAADAQYWLEDLEIPVWLVAGGSDRALDQPFLASLAARHPNVDVRTWPGRHDLPLAQPQRCLQLIAQVASQMGDARDRRLSP